MRRFKFTFVSFFFLSSFFSQDMEYTRRVLKYLCSEKCYGRGYLKNGLDVAAKFISAEVQQIGGKPLFSTGYYQWFDFDVNTFPDKVLVKVNGKLLKPGMDYIISPQSGSIKGKFSLQQKDSVTYFATNEQGRMLIQLKKKLTFSVATNSIASCTIDLLQQEHLKKIQTAEVDIQSKVLTKYINKNVCAYIPGTQNNDSLLVYSAHYDHLGGLGKKTFFPGANDNASGVSVLLNLMKYYTKYPPKYKTVFLFFAGEEAGLLGSKYFVESKVIDLKKVKFLINLDLLGTGDDGIMVVNGTVHENQFAALTNINTEKSLLKEIKKRGKAQNSDHYWFSEAGVPCFFIYTMGGISAYHDVYDIEKTLPLTKYKEVFELITAFVKGF